MLIKRFVILLVAVAAAGTAVAAEPPAGLQIQTTRPGAHVTFERSLGDGKALVSVQDAKQDPVLGLTDKDFTVARPDGAGKVVSVEPISKSVEVPRRVVLVLDNSFSMLERKAVAKLLEGVGAVLKHIRPIDDVRMVVFNDHGTVKVDGHNLRAEVFKSSNPAELSAFAVRAYEKKGVTDSTYLYEAMLAGIDAIRGTPATDPRFLVVFSDGEDLNSAFKGDVVTTAAKGIPNLHVFAIDFMPGPDIDGFLDTFAKQHQGQARKAGTGADLLTLFQQFGSRLDNLYIVSFAVAPLVGQTPKPAEPTAAPPPEATAAAPPEATATQAPEATAPPPAATVPAAEPAAPEAQARSNWWIWVLLLIVVIIIVFFATRKSKEKQK